MIDRIAVYVEIPEHLKVCYRAVEAVKEFLNITGNWRISNAYISLKEYACYVTNLLLNMLAFL